MADVLGLGSLAFVAGAISITSPCCLPLIPGYVSYIGGVAALEDGNRRRVMGAAALFVAGFALVFTLLGATASVFGEFLLTRLPLFIKISGVFVLVMGLAMLGLLRIPFLYREARLDLSRIQRGPAGAMPLGMAFAFGWTPCVGPVLGAILTSAAATHTVWKGTTLLFVYSLGMGIPFLLLAFGSSKANRAFAFLRRHARGVERLGGTLLVGMGVLLITGYWQQMFTPLIRWFSQRGWPPI
ncbi:MAG TPA: cytochrome c biogenesis CcdA family protein [Actinomycetota bacterium]